MSRRIKFNDASRSYQNRIKRNLRQKLFALQAEALKPYGLKFRSVEIECSHNYIEETIENFKCEILMSQLGETVPIRRVIFIKDKNNISDLTYSNLRNELKLELPSLHEIKKEISLCDQLFNIKENSKGVYLSLQEKLKILIPKIKKHFSDEACNILHIKFSADGAQIIKHKLILNVTFAVLNEGKIAETASGHYTFGLFDICNEDYETMCLCLEQLKTEIDNLDELEINGFKYRIEKYIGGDLKMLAIIYGINFANSNCPCVWCIWDKRKLNNIDINEVTNQIKREWSILDKEKGARTIEDSLNFAGSNGYVNKPIFSNIPFERIVIDMLHLFLRITDVLYDLFIRDLREIGGKQNTLIDLSKQPELRNFFLDLTEKYNIRRPYYVDCKAIKIRELQGPDKKKLFNNINLI